MSATRNPGFPRRRLLKGAAAGAVAAGAGTVAAAAPATAAAPAAGPADATADGVTFRWFGTSGWRVDTGARTLLVDPYLTRFPTGLFTKPFRAATPLTTDEDLVTEHIGHPELVLVTHSHWDHFNDVPFIAASTTAQIVGTETTYHLLRAYGVDPARIIVVRGGEVLDFGGYAVQVVSARHSRNGAHGYFAPGTLHGTAVPPRPETIADLPEGDTLAFHVSFDGGPSAFFMGASDFSERDTTGLRPDVAMIAPPTSTSTRDYVPRLLAALGNPRVLVPVHWDNFETPLTEPPQRDPAVDWDAFLGQVHATAPRSGVVLPAYLTPYRFG
ncbi:MBL fold metallo-hydrolase [Streptomyces sp. NRRL F-5123]|uniref:MBL fold metallo-hydrolase n=1 Tax=Streptomyces sp. NRRL F-5123 TaxID=1463856 RepID=UPI0004E0BD8E|nr:MBL fold metallo-hydrolase [Streptomyces sp. NRRL F-5123]